jgi:hypothetical protein
MARVSISPRRRLDTPLADDATGSRFERFVFAPLIALAVIGGLAGAIVVIALLFSLH